MTRSTPILRPPSWVAGAIASCGLSLLASSPGLAAPQPDTFPPAETFRNLQLITLTCSRENTASSCDKARAVANPLLDHPRLPTSCKDVLWSINQRAYPAESNSPNRRDSLDRSAKDLTVFCKPQIKPAAKSDSKSGAPFGSGNFGFGSPPPAR
ncbi:MAG: hypothetical protein WAM11_12500 [Cyanobium sp.]